MGARGPAASENSVTRHPPKQNAKVFTAEPAKVPDLVGEYDVATVAWWDAWVDSPQAHLFTATDWQTLLRLAPLVKLYQSKPTPQLASEIRQTEAKLGATVADRDRLGWKINAPDAPGKEGDEPSGSRDRPDPREGQA